VHRKLALTIGLLVVLLCVSCSAGGRLGAEDLSQELDALRSHAAEGALLAQDAAAGRSTRTFTREHSSALAESVAQAETSLKAATTEPALEATLSRLKVLAARIGSALERLSAAPRSQDLAIARELETSERLAAELG
jgi:hypothetical protein